ncbi:MAG: hypothetical protein RMY34_02420 [Aulosira sp. DedQUE10]|nr:hypothetical protein [Aulosira sp. DedQUE10]
MDFSYVCLEKFSSAEAAAPTFRYDRLRQRSFDGGSDNLTLCDRSTV